MLAEWLERLLTTCPDHLQDMGCLREMIGLRRRWQRYRDAWEPHCDRSRRLILAALRRCPRRRMVAVFGSGWLHDLPLEELATSFERVVLVDLFHPAYVRWHVRRYPNVRLVADDVTGALEAVWRAAHTPTLLLPQPRPTLFLDEPDLDWALSLNLLSQLPCLPEAYAREVGRANNPLLTEPAVAAFCRDLVTSHLDYLQRLPGVVTLLSDVAVRNVSLSGVEALRASTLYDVSLPWDGETWEWTLVPRRDTYPHHAEVLTVVGVEDIKNAPLRT